MSKSSKQTIYSLAAVAALGVAMSSPAMAAKPDNPGKGPRVSVTSATVCDIVGTDFVVTTRLRNGNTDPDKIGEPVVTYANTQAIAKIGPGKPTIGKNAIYFGGTAEISPEPPQLIPVDLVANFDLCEVIDGRLDNVNAEATIEYSEGGGSVDVRTISNNCSDDLATTDIIEPAGIKPTAEQIAAIQTLCSAP